jgi:hypothetical protein
MQCSLEMSRSYSLKTIKTLFALSRNVCAHEHCEQKLTDPRWGEVLADIAHIEGLRPGSARYNPTMTDKERRSFDNLILLCPVHHRLVDRLEADDYPVSRLRMMKEVHEAGSDGVSWIEDARAEHFARLLLHQIEVGHDSGTAPDADPPLKALPSLSALAGLLLEQIANGSNEGEALYERFANRAVANRLDESVKEALDELLQQGLVITADGRVFMPTYAGRQRAASAHTWRSLEQRRKKRRPPRQYRPE